MGKGGGANKFQPPPWITKKSPTPPPWTLDFKFRPMTLSNTPVLDLGIFFQGYPGTWRGVLQNDSNIREMGQPKPIYPIDIVVTRYSEPLQWLDPYLGRPGWRFFLYNTGRSPLPRYLCDHASVKCFENLENAGFEWHGYLRHLIDRCACHRLGTHASGKYHAMQLQVRATR